ncbi:MAG: restriction endonuclease subunit S, partial [Lachnospiraceae bacterium]|nr:restriction endonuclease subunit S [Lachnospiraceae bacterium]
KAVNESGISLIPANTVIMSFKLSIGKTAITPEPMYSNEAIMSFRDKHVVELLPDYIYYMFSGKNWEEGTNKAVMGKTLNKATLSGVKVSIHDIAKQREIVKVLDKLSFVIDNRQQELEKLDELIKARFVELFGNPVSNPMKWPVKMLKDLSVQINSGNTPKGGSENYVEEGITFFRSQNVWKDRLEMDDIAYIDAETHASMKRSSLKHGDILMTKTGRINTENSSLGRAALYDGEDDMANVNGHVYFIRLKDGVNNKFILRILVSPEYRDLIRSVCVGGIDKRQLNKEHIEDFPIICPPTEMVDDYVAFVNQVDKSKVV